MAKKKATELKRARNGAGSVKYLGNGKVRIYFMMPANPITGKPPYRTSVDGDTEDDARLKMSKKIAAVSEGSYKEPCYMTVSTLAAKYINEYTDHLKPSTKDKYENIIDLYIKPFLGKYRLFELNQSLVKGAYNQMQKKSAKGGVSAKTIHNIHGVFSSMIKKALLLDYLPKNPIMGIVLPRVEKKEMQAIEGDDVARFLEAIKGSKYQYLYFVDMFTGMRQGEILGLTWDCVNFKEGTITVKQQLQRIDGVYQLVSLKNDDKSRRTFPPALVVMDILRHVKAVQAQQKLALGGDYANPMNLVFTHEHGGHLVGNTVYVRFKNIVKRLGLDAIRFHDLRASCGLYARENGAGIKEIQMMLGHSKITTTMDIYGRRSNKLERENAEKMDAFIRSVWDKKA